MKTLIEKLTQAFGPSGYEKEVRQVALDAIKDHVDEWRIDALGNLIARKGTKARDGARIMLSAHIDEIGIIATHIDEKGFVRFTNIGGVRPDNCIAGRVRFLNGARGVIGVERLEPRDKVPSLENLFVDVGATSRADCPVKVGEVAGFERPFLELGTRLVSKAMDDRIAAAILVETLKNLTSSPHELYFVFSTQEEVGLRGATTAAYGIDPEIGISVDVTATGDTPKSSKMEVGLGKGAAIKVRDGGMLSDPRLVQAMIDAAERVSLPYQLEVLEGGTTDARAMQISRSGMPAGCVSIPCRYLHSPSEMVDYQDVQGAVSLLVELLSQPIRLG
ncbi:MAG TPA: M42 family metallopeptidase [Anaerolineaceae bacterium]